MNLSPCQARSKETYAATLKGCLLSGATASDFAGESFVTGNPLKGLLRSEWEHQLYCQLSLLHPLLNPAVSSVAELTRYLAT